MTTTRRISAAFLMFLVGLEGTLLAPRSAGQEPPNGSPGKEISRQAVEGTWGEPVDGMACRLIIQPHYVIGQAITAVIEVKNQSAKKRYLAPMLDPRTTKHLSIELSGPRGKVRQTLTEQGYYWLGESSYQPLEPGEVKRFEIADLRNYFGELMDWQSFPERKANAVATGRYAVQFLFRSPPVPARFKLNQSFINGKEVFEVKDVPREVTEGQWAHEIKSAPVSFQLAPLGKDDLVVHEWGVFTVFNDVKYANVNRKEEWGTLPSFFYRQFPQQRLRWVPSAWDKPIVHFYTRQTPLRVNVKVTFAEGAPVVWWPAVASPVEDRPFPMGADPKKTQAFRTLIWEGWLGNQVPSLRGQGPLVKATDFELPADCWLKQARLPDAAQLTVIGNIEGPGAVRFPGAKDRLETERFLYYDGLVPAPDYVRCEKIGATSMTLRNRAKFDITRLFLVDLRQRGVLRFAFVDGKKQTFKAGAALTIEPQRIIAEDWPATGMQQVRAALLDAGLFQAEADSLLEIWHKKLLQADGVTAFHILPASEYDRMLPLDILPAPTVKPARVGIALHPHLEIEPILAERVAVLIRQLDDVNVVQRNAAMKDLLEIGPMAISMLRAELKKGVPLEVSRRIEAVLERIDATQWLTLPAPVIKAK